MKQESIARKQRKRRPSALKTSVLSQVLTQAIVKLEDHLLSLTPGTEGYGEELRRTSHALSTICGTYFRGLEVSDFEARIDQLQKVINELQAETTLKRARGSANSVTSQSVN